MGESACFRTHRLCMVRTARTEGPFSSTPRHSAYACSACQYRVGPVHTCLQVWNDCPAWVGFQNCLKR